MVNYDLIANKNNEISGLGEVCTFDKKSYDFLSIFEENFGDFREWNKSLIARTRSDIEDECYEIIDKSNFRRIYEEFIYSLNDYFDNKYIFQGRPSIRVQKPNDKAAVFHIDSFTGHGKDLINFWIPLITTNKENTLWIVPPEITAEMLLRTKEKEWNAGKLDEKVRPLAQPMLLEYGQFLVFSNKVLHGCVNNNSDSIRISFDFRALPKNSSAGTKNKKYMFNLGYKKEVKDEILNANTVVYCNHLAKHISHEAQRAVILDFCQKNNFIVHREDSDWHGCDHYLPLMTEWSLKYPDEPIIIFSKMSLNLQNSSTIKALEKISKNLNNGFYFALESERLRL